MSFTQLIGMLYFWHIFVPLLGWNSAFPLCPPRLLWHCQTSPPSRCQPWAAWLERTSANRRGQRGHASPGPGTPTGSSNSERACSRRLGRWYAVGWTWSDVLTMGWITRPTWKKCLLLWDHRTQRYDTTTTKVSLHKNVFLYYHFKHCQPVVIQSKYFLILAAIGRWVECNTLPRRTNTLPRRTGGHSSTNQQQRWSLQESWAAPLGPSAPYRRWPQKTRIVTDIRKPPELRHLTFCHPNQPLGSVPFLVPSMHCSATPVATSQSPIILLWQTEHPMSP